MFGAGIYLGPPDKAISYTGHSWTRSRSAGDLKAAYILQVKAVLGKVLECDRSRKYSLGVLRQEGFDSVAGVAGRTASWGRSTLRHSENVVYSPDQVLALKVFEYQLSVESYKDLYKPTSGLCDVVYKANVHIPPGQKAFADVLSMKNCDAIATTLLKTDDNCTVWVCDSCIQKYKLKAGSRLQVKTTRWKGPAYKTVRIVGYG